MISLYETGIVFLSLPVLVPALLNAVLESAAQCHAPTMLLIQAPVPPRYHASVCAGVILAWTCTFSHGDSPC